MMTESESLAEAEVGAPDGKPLRRRRTLLLGRFGMPAAVLVMGLIVMVLLAGSIPVPGGEILTVFSSPAFLALWTILALFLIAACCRPRTPLRWLGFAACHLGVVCVLIGAWLAHRGATRRDLKVMTGGDPVTELPSSCPQFRLQTFFGHIHQVLESAMGLPVDPGELAARLAPCPNHHPQHCAPVELGFPVTVKGFSVDYHDPDYDLFRYEADQDAWQHVRTLPVGGADILDLGEAGRVARARLRQEGAWVEHLSIDEHWVLQRGSMTPRLFSAEVVFADLPAQTIRVNHPLDHRDWRFYLGAYRAMPPASSDEEDEAWQVTLIARRDPGRRWAVLGFWMILAGTPLLCLRRRPRKDRS